MQSFSERYRVFSMFFSLHGAQHADRVKYRRRRHYFVISCFKSAVVSLTECVPNFNRRTGGDRRIRVARLRVSLPVFGLLPIRCTLRHYATHLGRRGHLARGSRSGRRNCHRRKTHQGSTGHPHIRGAGHRGTSRHCHRERMDRGQPIPAKRVRRLPWW